MIALARLAEEAGGLTLGGIVVMSFSVTLVLGLSAFCLTRILREPTPSEHHKTPLNIDTRDLE